MDKELKSRIMAIIQKESETDIEKTDPIREAKERVPPDYLLLFRISARLQKSLNIRLPLTALDSVTLHEFLRFIEKVITTKKPLN